MGSSVKKVVILGSTGSIGRQTAEVIRAFPENFKVVGMAGGKNNALLAGQVNEFKPQYVCCQDEGALYQSGLTRQDRLIQFISLEEMASLPEADIIVIATSGKLGISPTLAAIRARKLIALANKEALVMAGQIVISEAKKFNVTIMPVDSEHSAIWQCLQGEKAEAIRKIILTASGGPFREMPAEKLDSVTVSEALKHPTWKMGPKVTIDSATLVNKGLEAMEAHWLFSVPLERIAILIHPESIIHSMVEFRDGSTKAQLSLPDMRLPIQYALCYPDRPLARYLAPIDWSRVNKLTFEQPDWRKFPGLKLALEAGARGGTYPAVFCAADEAAVSQFLAGQIAFGDISRIIEETVSRHQFKSSPTIEDIWQADEWAREFIKNLRVKSSAI